MSKVKVPAVFDKWYKQVEEKSIYSDFKHRAMYLIASQGFGYCVADENNILEIDFDLTEKEANTMRYYVGNHKEDAMRAILDGYEVEEQLYYIRIPHLEGSVVNYDLEDGHFFTSNTVEDAFIQTKFTMSFIEKNLPEFKQYAVKAEE
ncbi:DUF1642 domain-containing protein [Pediococcus pentosaceus]|uniref:DUF1642 domain-containing protein n=1 Tax=Pediococcus pentosaceus TaxID=1255 RepID=A0ABD7X9Y1_PEDPE|nr:DUF1642 domain-containing protein [Pediococcus pentosaceus]MDB1562936.1 DUF1642 domain-containing protein [Pediococcus pentosaceus]WEA58299.1 DUF1642 domain-containing protein [Pediococcus pentosaceus]